MNDQTRQQLENQYDLAEELYSEEKYEEALTILKPLAEVGFPPAFFKLALYAFYVGNRDETGPWLARLEAAAARGNAHSCYLCYLAYRGGWTGLGRAVNNPIGSRYVLRAAELGHTHAQYTLAQELRSGANDQIKSESGYLYWIEKAIEGGSEDAIYDHIVWLDKHGRPIHETLLADLDVLAEDYPNAAKLREKLKRRAKR